MGIEEKYNRIRADIDDCCMVFGRDPHTVLLVAVSKTVGVETIAEAVQVGVRNFGENRPDSLKEKYKAFPEVNWHFIGNVQSRRIDDIVACSTLIHSVYKPEHVSKIDAAAKRYQKVQNILLEVNVSGEQSKGGLAPEEIESVLEHAENFENVCVKGLMTMAPQGNRPAAKICFEKLVDIRDEMQRRGAAENKNRSLHELSMGMSEDWREALGVGATMIRIGRAIFDDTFVMADFEIA